MADIMLDLETWGLAPGSALRSVGAVTFLREGDAELPAEFSCNISLESCLLAGLVVDPNTRDWWGRQDAAAQDSLVADQLPLRDAVVLFHKWVRGTRCTAIWCQGAGFDVPLWEAAARAVGLEVPWKYWDVRDTHTAYDLLGLDPRRVPRAGTHHNALEDARHQAECVRTAIKRRPM